MKRSTWVDDLYTSPLARHHRWSFPLRRRRLCLLLLLGGSQTGKKHREVESAPVQP